MLLMAASALAGVTATGTADQAKFDGLNGPFRTGEDVTRACLACHTEAARQVMATRHWSWEFVNADTGQKLGKKTMLNGFCIGNRSNESFCQSCHVGYGWKDEAFDFTAESAVDCLACHNTGDYRKLAGFAGHPPYERIEYPAKSGKFVEAVDLAKVAQQVGATSRQTCGACHYYGGGGDGVKHGDLDSSLNKATKVLDVHMAQDGLDFSCASCHEADRHKVAGSRISMTGADPHGAVIRGQKNRPQSGKLPGLSWRPPTQRQPRPCRTPERSHPHAGVPDLPHSRIRPRRRADQDELGLVCGRQADSRRPALPTQGRSRARNLRQQEGRVRAGCQ